MEVATAGVEGGGVSPRAPAARGAAGLGGPAAASTE